jgi:hypothetical protein
MLCQNVNTFLKNITGENFTQTAYTIDGLMGRLNLLPKCTSKEIKTIKAKVRNFYDGILGNLGNSAQSTKIMRNLNNALRKIRVRFSLDPLGVFASHGNPSSGKAFVVYSSRSDCELAMIHELAHTAVEVVLRKNCKYGDSIAEEDISMFFELYALQQKRLRGKEVDAGRLLCFVRLVDLFMEVVYADIICDGLSDSVKLDSQSDEFDQLCGQIQAFSQNPRAFLMESQKFSPYVKNIPNENLFWKLCLRCSKYYEMPKAVSINDKKEKLLTESIQLAKNDLGALCLEYKYELCDGKRIRDQQSIFGEHTYGLFNAVSLFELQQPMKKKIDILKKPQKGVMSPENMKRTCVFLLEILTEQRKKIK